MSYSTGNRGGGRRSYGERSPVSARPPEDDKTVWQKSADELGIALGSYVILVVNEKNNLPIPDFVLDEIEKAQKARELSMLEGLRIQRAS